MADNTTLNTGAGGDVIATDDVTTLNGSASSGIKVQRVKVCFGDDNTARDSSATFPFPVTVDTQSKATYSAVMARVTTGALTANTLKAVMSFEHAAISTKTVRFRSIKVSGYATSATAGTVEFQLTRGTAASSGGTAVTPTPCNPADAAADTVVKTIPTITAATVLWVGNATAVPATANSSIGSAFELLYDPALDNAKDFTLRAANLDTLVINVISTAAITLTLNITAIFTEE